MISLCYFTLKSNSSQLFQATNQTEYLFESIVKFNLVQDNSVLNKYTPNIN